MVPKAAIFVLIIAAFTTCAVAHGQDRTRDLSANVPASQIRTVVVEAKVGTVRLTGTNDTTAKIDLRLEAKSNYSFWRGRNRGNPDGVDLITEVSGTELRISLRGDRENLEEEWTIAVPARVLARVTASVGEVNLAGVTGGCEANVGVGEVRIDVPEGEIRASTSVGDIRVRTGTRSYGNIDVTASVGDTRLIVDGQRINNSRQGYGPSSRVSLDGNGKDRIDVRASVGDAQVTVR